MAKSIQNLPTSASSSGEDFQETQEPQTVQPPNNSETSPQLANPGTSLPNPGTSLQPPNPGTWQPLERPLGTRPKWLYVKHQKIAGTSTLRESQKPPENKIAKPQTDQRPMKIIKMPRNSPRPVPISSNLRMLQMNRGKNS